MSTITINNVVYDLTTMSEQELANISILANAVSTNSDTMAKIKEAILSSKSSAAVQSAKRMIVSNSESTIRRSDEVLAKGITASSKAIVIGSDIVLNVVDKVLSKADSYMDSKMNQKAIREELKKREISRLESGLK